MSKCTDTGQRMEKVCEKTRDDGYDYCKEYRDDGYNSCDKWDKNCCDWWPCSWGCKIISWFCAAWIWISNIVCVASVWVANVVCVAWRWISTGICIAADVVMMIGGAIIGTLESILGWVLSAVAFVIELFLTVPIIGRILAWIIAAAESVYWLIVGIIDTVAGILGIRPEKKLRICTIILADENGRPIVPASMVVPWLQKAVDVYRDEANIRVIPVAPFQYTSGFSDKETVTEGWIHVRTKPESKRVLDLGGEGATAGADLIDIGCLYNAIANTECFYGTWRKLTGYGAPITVFIIRSMEEGVGRSLGPLTDYVLIGGAQNVDITDVTHEMGHACYLWHVDNGGLMNTTAPRGSSLEWWQVAIVRSSRHVTYF